MDLHEREIYDDFYVAYFNKRGDIIFPSDINEVFIIRQMLKKTSRSSLIFLEDRNLYYKVRIKRKIIDGENVQIVELSNVTEFYKQISNASVDEITNLNNRKIARNLFVEYLDLAYKRGDDFSVILADLDGFKTVNDTYGHINGDIVLSEVSRMLFCSTRQESFREQDIVARLGGDEFIIVMKNASENICNQRAENMRKKVEEHMITLFNEQGDINQIKAGTLSIGLYSITSDVLKDLYDKGYTTDEIRTLIIDRCDSALYKSKNNGKNKVTSFSYEKELQLKKC